MMPKGTKRIMINMADYPEYGNELFFVVQLDVE